MFPTFYEVDSSLSRESHPARFPLTSRFDCFWADLRAGHEGFVPPDNYPDTSFQTVRTPRQLPRLPLPKLLFL
jgi:hypothetical protein